ncbi:IclR family transcriptional regulator [Streptomyces sp. NPDC001508]|uniref:IclR family transcriptional regulator n=1 Tax=Streptomyces sp. NPDC001508 TaxID=3154656 RepID=UPI00332A9594
MQQPIPRNGTTKVGANILAALSAFGRQGTWGVTELANELGLSKTATHRLLKTLAMNGFVEQLPGRSDYVLGVEVIALARQAAAKTTVGSVGHSHLVRLAESTQEVVSIDVLRGYRYVCVDMVSIHPHVTTTVQIGDTIGLHAGAGKVILAYQHPAFVDEVLKEPLTRYTDNTPHEPSVIRAMLEKVRAEGRWVSEGEITPAARGLTMPIFGPRSSVEAVLTVTSTKARIPDSRVGELFSLMRQTCDQIAWDMGNREPVSP